MNNPSFLWIWNLKFGIYLQNKSLRFSDEFEHSNWFYWTSHCLDHMLFFFCNKYLRKSRGWVCTISKSRIRLSLGWCLNKRIRKKKFMWIIVLCKLRTCLSERRLQLLNQLNCVIILIISFFFIWENCICFWCRLQFIQFWSQSFELIFIAPFLRKTPCFFSRYRALHSLNEGNANEMFNGVNWWF